MTIGALAHALVTWDPLFTQTGGLKPNEPKGPMAVPTAGHPPGPDGPEATNGLGGHELVPATSEPSGPGVAHG